MTTRERTLRQQVLRERAGLPQDTELDLDARRNGDKTPMMLVLEHAFGLSIEELLSTEHSTREVAQKLGVHYSQVSRWRTRLGLVVKLE